MPASGPRDAARGNALPARYGIDWLGLFEARIAPALVDGVRILDMGSGCRPVLPPNKRPRAAEYVGLDLSRAELEKAPPGSYDAMVTANVVDHQPSLVDRFDLIVSWQVLEHVRPLDMAIEHLRTYLRPGGLLVAMLSGAFSAFGLVNKATPAWFGPWVLRHVTGRDPSSVFPAYYDGCHYGALCRMLANWSEGTVESHFRGAAYFRRWPTLQRIYLGYENRVARVPRRTLASHYLIAARR